jgi:hypothetical protein
MWSDKVVTNDSHIWVSHILTLIYGASHMRVIWNNYWYQGNHAQLSLSPNVKMGSRGRLCSVLRDDHTIINVVIPILNYSHEK